MANTYTQIYMHIVFAVARREALIPDAWMPALHAYLAGACRNRGHFVHAVGGTADHVHILMGMHPAESVANLVKELKGQSTRWVNDNHSHGAFSWQAGYGAFSYSRTHVPAVKAYVENQHEHHRRVTFEEELADIFSKFGIDYQPQYMMRGFVEAVECRVPKGTPAAANHPLPAVETAGYHCQTPNGVTAADNHPLPAVETAGYHCQTPNGVTAEANHPLPAVETAGYPCQMPTASAAHLFGAKKMNNHSL